MNTQTYTIEKLKELLSPIATELGLERIIVFGSYARGEQGVASDLDLIIDSGGRLKGKHLFSAIYKIDRLIPMKTDIFELSEVKKPSQTYTAILNEGVTIYER
ncbi:MAG: nucleotidyltransferase domain-containing protein [Defluviitaleaceae bacterium]|nr:nucleotidyltransferase domain-containing protein [Defluviitaleaceae bacterium]MCL2275434.1 nucleotidyltransferase domain-containing protein [Defluviitaleaceae bacterium]